MELKVKTPTFPEVIEFNFEELKKEITERASAYVNLVYTDDQIADAKKDRSNLNKFVKALSDERIKVKKECLKAYEDFEVKIKELDAIVYQAIKNIDSQVKGYEEKKKSEKLEEIKKYWQEKKKPFAIEFERIMDAKWLNASVSMKSIQTAIDNLIDRINLDLDTLSKLPEFSFEATDVYKTTLDLGKAINESHRLSEMAKRKAEAERIAAERKAEAEMAKHMNPPESEQIEGQISFNDAESFERNVLKPAEPQREAICFRAYLTPEDALALKEFFDSRGIPFEAI